ncbi:sodium:proton antiporter NhaD [Magnetovirga frankeli]|uniref:sodium:proton antiporter NhaD n=1 Tax=Magnetovirga frankeli TaxID=947516 RepID=UPI001AF7357F|nr:sodium:proton antiporter NhaD [gamma proteobacterium SS-5]
MSKLSLLLLFLLPLGLFPLSALAYDASEGIRLTEHWIGPTALILFGLAYGLVMAEELTGLRKSKPVILAAGLIWLMIAWVYSSQGMTQQVEYELRHHLLQYVQLMLFLLVAMTYINALDERQVFTALRCWLIRKGFGFRKLFWITGALAFFISPIADNLTTALLMYAVVLAVAGGNSAFILLGAINIVVATNAGGAFSPFGDITTLMVWQRGVETAQGPVNLWAFFALFLPALVNWLVPALIMSFSVPNEVPATQCAVGGMKRGARRIIGLFLLTIATAVLFHQLHMPPVIGMLTGLAYLQFFGFYLKRTYQRERLRDSRKAARTELEHDGQMGDPVAFDVYNRIARAEWDTLLFFYGVVMCVGGLGFIGYLAMASELMYIDWGATQANIAVGVLSAIIDNIPVIYAILTMLPDMSLGQWLLVTLTAAVGGSLLSIGSAAGVALMAQSGGYYSFIGHLKWTPVIALGYAASIACHLWLNGGLF